MVDAHLQHFRVGICTPNPKYYHHHHKFICAAAQITARRRRCGIMGIHLHPGSWGFGGCFGDDNGTKENKDTSIDFNKLWENSFALRGGNRGSVLSFQEICAPVLVKLESILINANADRCINLFVVSLARGDLYGAWETLFRSYQYQSRLHRVRCIHSTSPQVAGRLA